MPAAAAVVEHCESWSVDELAVLATIVGAVSFPTVPPDLLLALPDDSLEPTVGAVIRGLIARRVLRPHDGAGRPLFEGIVRDQIDAAVAAELTLLLERFDSSGADVWWFGVGVDQTVQIRARRDGTRQMGLVATAAVVAQILSIGCPEAGPNGSGSQDDRSITAAEIFAADSDVHSVGRLTATWRTGNLIHGGDLTWAVDSDGALSLLAPTGGRSGDPNEEFTLQSVSSDDLRWRILACLPGDDSIDDHARTSDDQRTPS